MTNPRILIRLFLFIALIIFACWKFGFINFGQDEPPLVPVMIK